MPILFYRADDEEADDDDTLPRPALPVPDGPAVVDESIPPADGLDYLKRVRAQAGTLPDVMRIPRDQQRQWKQDSGASRNPGSNSSHRQSLIAALEAAASAPLAPPPPSLRPRAAFQEQLLADVAEVRTRLLQLLPGHKGAKPPAAASWPDASDTAAWVAWSLGAASAGAGSKGSGGGGDGHGGRGGGSGRAWARPAASAWPEAQLPTPQRLAALNTSRAIGLLRGLLVALDAERATLPPPLNNPLPPTASSAEPAVPAPWAAALVEAEVAPSEPLARWAFAALMRLENAYHDADTGAAVRALYTSCSAVRAELGAALLANGGAAASAWSALPAPAARRVARLNVLITLSGGLFGQAPRDEWMGD
jgi:survival of motor neuron protein-interacting protein 1